MKSKLFTTFLSLWLVSSASAQEHMEKILHIWGNGMPYAKSILAVDNAGNIYLTGMFEDTVFFDSKDNFVVPMDSTDFYIVKINPDGSTAWKTIISGAGAEWLYDLEIDNTGNIIFTGDYDLSLQVDTAYVETGLESGYGVSFLCKLDPEGRLISLFGQSGAEEHLSLHSLDLDQDGQIYLIGASQGSSAFDVQLNPDPLLDGWTSFAAHLNDSFEAEWLATLCDSVETFSGGYYYSVTELDYQGNVYVAGVKSGGSNESFISKLGSDGAVHWIKTMNDNSNNRISEMYTDKYGNVYVIGEEPGLFAKFDPDGENLWSASVDSRIWTSVVNPDGYTIATYFHDWGSLDGFIILDPAGTVIVDYPFEDIVVEQLAMDEEGNIYYNGSFLDGITMNGEAIDTENGTNYVMGILKFAEIIGGSNSESVSYPDHVHLYPNPVKDNLTIRSRLEAPLHIEIISIAGRSVYTKEMPEEHILLDLTFLSKGIYIVTLRSKDLVRTEKIIKM